MTTTTTDPTVVPVSEVRGVKLHELKAMVEAARAAGAKRLRIGEVEVEVAPLPEPEKPPELTEKQIAELTKELVGEMPDSGDLLMWSAPGPLPSEESKA